MESARSFSSAPGTTTGLGLYLPLAVMVLRASRGRMSPVGFTRAVLLGVALHGMVAIVAFL